MRHIAILLGVLLCVAACRWANGPTCSWGRCYKSGAWVSEASLNRPVDRQPAYCHPVFEQAKRGRHSQTARARREWCATWR